MILTWGASVEVVVVLGNVCEDTEPVRNFEGHHVFCIQERRNSELLLGDPEGLRRSTVSSSTEIHTLACWDEK